MSDIAALKQADREKAFAHRESLVCSDAGEQAAFHFLNAMDLPSNVIISLYWPIGSELDTRPLLDQLHTRKAACLLPVVEQKNQPLVFKLWRRGDVLETGSFGTRVPSDNAQIRIPDILIVPLLAFDAMGNRLGYGGGFYDRTLQALRRAKECVSVGFAYAGQEVDRVQTDQFDQTLDWIVTEKNVRKIL